MKMQQGAERFGAKTEFAEIIGVDFSEKIKKIFTDYDTYFAKAVIIAAGANPRKLGILNEDEFTGRGIHYCAHCDGRFYKDKTVAVVGGGNSAAADALYLSRLAKKVYIIHRRDTLRATKLYHDPLKTDKNIEFLWDSTVSEFITDQKFNGVVIKNLKTDAEEKIICDAVFVSIGRKPATDFLKDAVLLDQNGYIVADETTKTNVEGVFAAGDIRTKALRQVVTAVSDGAVAANMAEEYLSGL